jgi:hypothetical protein
MPFAACLFLRDGEHPGRAAGMDYEEVGRFQVAVRRSPDRSGALVLSDASARKLRSALHAAGEGAYHVFDYATQEAIIYRPVKQVGLDAAEG